VRKMAAMQKVYLETTIVSYLAAKASRDLVVAAHQQITQDWWQTARDRFDLYVSEAVLDEVRAGDPEAVDRRLRFIRDLPVLVLNVLLDRFQEQEKLDQERLVSDTSPRIKQDCGTEPQRGAGSTRRGDDGM
jgi:hypothetical protein